MKKSLYKKRLVISCVQHSVRRNLYYYPFWWCQVERLIMFAERRRIKKMIV